MSAPRMRRRYRATGSSRRGLIYLFGFLGVAALYVGQRVYTDRQRFVLGRLEQEVVFRQAKLDSLHAERDRLTSYAEITKRAQALGLRPADLKQLARVPLSAPVPGLAEAAAPAGFGVAAARVWRWLGGPEGQKQQLQAAP